MSDRNEEELDLLRKRYEGNRRFRDATTRGISSLFFIWIIRCFIEVFGVSLLDTPFQRACYLLLCLIIATLAMLSNYYGPLRTKKYSIIQHRRWNHE